MSLRYKGCASLALVFLPVLGVAHHSVNSTFDVNNNMELTGEVTSVSWRNPHVNFSLRVSGEADSAQEWSIQMTSVSTLRRRKLTADFLSVGDRVHIYGSPAKNGDRAVYVRNILLPNGNEIILQTSGEARWPDISSAGLGISQNDRPGDRSAPELGIFRVWSTPIRGDSLWNNSYPLTDAARASVEAFNPETDSPTQGCSPKGMPTIMEQPYPMEFRQQGETIGIHLEEYDTVRLINMNTDTNHDEMAPTRLGYSSGRWVGSTLVVATEQIDWSYFDRDGVPLSEDVKILEHFVISEDGSRLDYEMKVTDPETFTEPVVLDKYWLWYPEVQVQLFGCEAE